MLWTSSAATGRPSRLRIPAMPHIELVFAGTAGEAIEHGRRMAAHDCRREAPVTIRTRAFPQTLTWNGEHRITVVAMTAVGEREAVAGGMHCIDDSRIEAAAR